MARKHKVLIKEGVDVRNIGYYSTPRFVADYITQEMLDLNPNGNLALDPAVGKEELLSLFYHHGVTIDSFDIIRHKESYGMSNFHHEDFINYFLNISIGGLFGVNAPNYDYIIANPPYNCHEVDYIHNNREKLSKAFPVGIHNMYSIFLSALIDIAQEGCLIGVILSDSFLTSNAHSKLRNKILNSCSIHELILCPTSLFHSQQADVRTCIMILQKGKKFQGFVKVKNRPSSIQEFNRILNEHDFDFSPIESVCLNLKNGQSPFIIGVSKCFTTLFDTNKTLGDVYPCITSISTGNDKKYLSNVLKDGYSIPFYKNPGKRKFKCSPDSYLIDSFIEESKNVKDFMVRNKQYLDLPGIACSSMGIPFSAVYLPENAVSGVNASIYPPSDDIYWLLAYLNSSLVTYLIRGILIRSNMVTSGYVSSLPLLDFSAEDKKTLSRLSLDVINDSISESDALKEIDKIVFSTGKINDFSKSVVIEFCLNLYKLV